MTLLPIDPQDALIAAEIRQDIEARGKPIGMADYLIAAVCLSSNCVLLTRNLKHFERIDGLKLTATSH